MIIQRLAGKNVRYRQRRTVDDEESAPETALPEIEASFKGTVVSSADGAKILNNRGKVAEESRNKSGRTKTFIGDMARAFGARPYGSGSQYTTFETRNGKIVTIRLADHNASTIRFILIRSILPTALTGTWLNTQRVCRTSSYARRKKSSPEGGVSSIRHADDAAPAISLQSRGDVESYLEW